jgi:hypothetical protein
MKIDNKFDSLWSEDIKVGEKTYKIHFTINNMLKLDFDALQGEPSPTNLPPKKIMLWVCAYVQLDREVTEDDNYTWTYSKNGWFGVDTMHGYNDDMTLLQKKKDAISQITTLLESENDSTL